MGNKIEILGYCVFVIIPTFDQIVFRQNKIIDKLNFQWKIYNGKTVKAI